LPDRRGVAAGSRKRWALAGMGLPVAWKAHLGEPKVRIDRRQA